MVYITPQEALQRLPSSKRKAKGKGTATEFVRGIWPKVADNCAVYLFRRGKGGIIAPAIDTLPPLLGESDNADFSVELPPQLESWLKDYADEVDYSVFGSWLVEDEVGGGDALRADIPQLCQAVWGQDAPYNDNLTFGGSKCKVGCWAVMVGIIMQYWGSKGYHRGCMATSKYSYVGRSYGIPGCAPITAFDYAHLASKPKTSAEKKAVATMLEYIGKACKVDYASAVTYAYTSISTPFLSSRLRLGSKIKAISASTLGTAKFAQLVYEELSQGRPVGMRGAHGNSGHYFVCDGYRAADDKYHFNWGWDGKYNGYYAMSALNPTAANTYNEGKQAIVGIQPEYKLGDIDGDGDITVTDVMRINNQIVKGGATMQSDINSDGDVTATDATLVVKHILGKEAL